MLSRRIEFLDFARGMALIAMTIFHFAFDLEMFGMVERGFVGQPEWKYFARAIASTFLFLVGFSLYLAHGDSIHWAKWRKRMFFIFAAALAITAVTWFATPGQYIFFGILHAIAFASLVGLMFLAFPWWLTALIGGLVFIIGKSVQTPFLDHWFFWWTGLQALTPISSDYVPVFPWFSAPLLGLAVAKLCSERGWLHILAKPRLEQPLSQLLKFIGRHSLIYYLLHQPVIIGLLLGFLYLTGKANF